MIHPNRYTLVHIGKDLWMHKPDNRMEAAPAGVYISEADYAAIAAENERLRSSQLSLEKWIACEQIHFDTADNLREKLYQASVQIERLRKAGDAFFDSVIGYYGEHILEDEKHSSGQKCRDWLAAKEGGRK